MLLSALDSGQGSLEQWTSVQCLALAGVSSPAVITSLLQHLLKQNVDEREQAAALLSRVSKKTVSCKTLINILQHCEYAFNTASTLSTLEYNLVGITVQQWLCSDSALLHL